MENHLKLKVGVVNLRMYSGEKYFRERVDSLIDTYSDEEIVCANRPEA